ncbi:MAG: hypothetical protein EXQ47_05420 [Bryobacterales bacterium]|nr:hypothetical protein [Bryobacterales bacterium]
MSDEKVRVERSEDFEEVYANNVRYESSVWDLKMLFGQLDLSRTPPEIIRLHTGMTVPWTAAKIAAYFMVVNVILHQNANGEIKVPDQVLPPRPDPDSPELDNLGKDTVTYLSWVYDQFFGPDPYIPPGVDVGKI